MSAVKYTKALECIAHISFKTIHVSHNAPIVFESNAFNSAHYYICSTEGAGSRGHQLGHHGETDHIDVRPPPGISTSRSRSPFWTPATCSRRKRAKPTPCVVLKSLPVPRGRETGRDISPLLLTKGRISIFEGKVCEVREVISSGLQRQMRH